MSNTIVLKKSATPSAIPLIVDLAFGELAVNTYDGKIFLKKNDGVDSIVEIGAGGGGVPLYTNAVPMPEAVGGYDVGTTFANEVYEDMWDGLLYPYQYPEFNAFLIAAQDTTLECGVEIPAGFNTFTWGTLNPLNVAPNTLVIRDMTAAVDLATGLADDGTESVDIGPAVTKTVTNTTNQWRIEGTDTQAGLFNRLFTVIWFSPFYYGVGVPALTVAQIQALTKQVVAKSDKTYSFSPTNEVYYFAYPASHGDLTSILDNNGFETIGDWTKRVESFTNNPPDYEGVAVSYNVYEFNNLTTQVGFNNTFKF